MTLSHKNTFCDTNAKYHGSHSRKSLSKPENTMIQLAQSCLMFLIAKLLSKKVHSR